MAAPRKHSLSTRDYNSLRGDIQRLLASGSSKISEDRISAYWRIGKRISTERITRAAGYHNSVLQQLAKDTNVSIRTLQRTIILHSFYKRPPLKNGLSWSHLRALLQVSDASTRRRLTKLAIKEALTSRELGAVVENLGQEEIRDTNLKRPNDPAYLYEANVHSVVDGDTLVLNLDLGFQVSRRQRIRLALINTSPLTTKKGALAKQFLTEQVLAHPYMVVKTNRIDIYGRYIAHIFVSARKTSIRTCFEKGLYLNDLLIEKKHARKSL